MKYSLLGRLLAPAAGVVVCLMLLAPFEAAEAAGAAEAGKAVYEKKCKTCHAAGGEGSAAIAKAMKVTLKHLGSKAVQDKKDDELKGNITEGTGKMKPVAGLTPDEIASVIAYVRTLKEK